jgi:hypothetical protein
VTSRSWRRLIAWSLFAVGFVAFVKHEGEFERMDAWGWVALPMLAAAPLVGFRRGSILKWLLASLPFWVFGGVHEAITLTAVGLTIAGPVIGGFLPLLPGRRVKSPGPPLPHLVSGPLVPVQPMQVSGGRRSRFVKYSAIGAAVTAVALFVAAAAGYERDTTTALGISAVLISATFFFGNWFADRVRVRIDDVGVHGRTLFREHTARWNEITGIDMRYVIGPGYGLRVVTYVVQSTSTQVSFSSGMVGADELRAAIEAATGMQWPEPEITATM